jgi:hypothetical protein
MRPVEAAALDQQHRSSCSSLEDELLVVAIGYIFGSRRGNMYSAAFGLTQVTPGICVSSS